MNKNENQENDYFPCIWPNCDMCMCTYSSVFYSRVFTCVMMT